VIVNTHSPLVVREVPDDTLVVAEPQQVDATQFGLDAVVPTVRFAALEGTWRTGTQKARVPACSMGRLIGYLSPLATHDEEVPMRQRRKRVIDRDDVQPLLPFRRDPANAH
jgi:hypothetical protein